MVRPLCSKKSPSSKISWSSLSSGKRALFVSATVADASVTDFHELVTVSLDSPCDMFRGFIGFLSMTFCLECVLRCVQCFHAQSRVCKHAQEIQGQAWGSDSYYRVFRNCRLTLRSLKGYTRTAVAADFMHSTIRALHALRSYVVSEQTVGLDHPIARVWISTSAATCRSI